MLMRGSRSKKPCTIETMESRFMLADTAGTFDALHPQTFQDPKTGNTATFAMSGPGSGTVAVGANGFWTFTFDNTTRATIVTVGGQDVQVEQITATKPMGALNAPKLDWVAASTTSRASTIDFLGGILKLQLDDLSVMDGVSHALTIGLPDRPTDATTIILDEANDLDVEAQMPIAQFTAGSYIAHGNYRPAVHTTGYFGAIAIAHDVTGVATTGNFARPSFHAELPNRNGKGIASLSIGGNITNVKIYTDAGHVGPVTIAGTMDNSSVYTSYGSLAKATIGGSMNNKSDLHSTNGAFAGATVSGSMDTSKIYADGIASLGPVFVGGSVNNNSEIRAGSIGNLNTVTIAGALNRSSIFTSAGSINRVTVGQGMTNSANIHSTNGALKAVVITGDVSGTSSIYVGGVGALSAVTITGSLNDSSIYATAGDLARVTIGGSVANNAVVRTTSGNIGSLAIAQNLDSGSSVTVGRGLAGLKKMTVGGNVGPGVTISANDTKIGTLAIAGSVLGTGTGNPQRVSITADGGIASLSIGQNTNYLHVGSSAGPIKKVKIVGVMQNSDISSDTAITIGSVTVGQLDNSRISTGLATTTLTRQRTDFQAAGTIASVKVTGVNGNFMTNNSIIASWFMGKVSFAAPSTGSGVIESHTGTVVNAPTNGSGQSLFSLIA